MENTSLITLSRAAALQRQMQVVANNIANMNTTGFKGESPLFIEYVEHPQKDETYSMVQDYATLRDTTSGAISQTGNPLDLALEGDAYFAVSTLDGVRYTRSGNFSMNDQRELVNASGLPVMDDTGNVMTIPASAEDIRINPQGIVSTNLGTVGQIQLATFKDEQKMIQLGSGLYQTDEKPTNSETTLVRQGFLEKSNVNSIQEMTNMIEINRQYQSVQNILRSEHERLRNAYTKLSRLS